MRVSSAPGCRDAAIDQRESPGATVIESGEVGAGVAEESGEARGGSWVGSQGCGLSAHVSESPGDELSCGAAIEAAIGAVLTSADPMSALAPARASIERASLVPQRATSPCATRRTAGGAPRRSTRWAHAELRRLQISRKSARAPSIRRIRVSGCSGSRGGASLVR